MTRIVRQRVKVQEGGRIELRSAELRAGQEAEVLVLVVEEAAGARTNRSFLGSGRGAFASERDVDEFLRRERDQWER